MSRRLKTAFAIVLVSTFASTVLAGSSSGKVAHRAPVTSPQGRNAGAFVPFSPDEQRWFDRASMPNNQ
jgi:hypothetical protein